MSNNLKRLMSFLLACVLLVGLLPSFTLPSEALNQPRTDVYEKRTAALYSKSWDRWSQGGSKYYGMVKAGCRVIAEIKLAGEAGLIPAGVNPDHYFLWLHKNGGFQKDHNGPNKNICMLETGSVGENLRTYLSKTFNVKIDPPKAITLPDGAAKRVSTVMNYINGGYYVILEGGGHYSYVDRGRSLKAMLMYGKEASNRKQEIDRQHYTIPNQRPKDKHCGKI